MLIGRLVDEKGQGDTPILADTHDKAYYLALTDAGRVRCPDCDARLKHRSAKTDSDPEILKEKFRCEAIGVDGRPEARVPHWYTDKIEDHAPGCNYRDDPNIKEHIETFRQALNAGRKILVKINFDVGFEGLRNRFNRAAETSNGHLAAREAWETQNKDHLSVPARDITDVLHYLTIAKALKGLKGMQQLHFLCLDSVQSFDRFVVRDIKKRVSDVVTQIFRRAVESSARQQHFQEAPRLFMFKVSERQQRLAFNTIMSKIFGQYYEGMPYGEYPDGSTARHNVKMGMELREPRITNQTVVDKGLVLWVVATPTLLFHEIKRMREKARGKKISNPAKPAFLMLNVEKRGAIGVVGSEYHKPRHEEATLQPRQHDLFDPQTAPRGKKTRTIAAAMPAPVRRGPKSA